MTGSAREHDIVLYGATGFVGVLTAKYLAEQAPADVRIALGGRSEEKLERTRDELGVDWPLVVAEGQDRDAIAALAESARVVATTVGPYFKYGKPLVEACAAAGTHYADLTGEVLFMRWSIDAADEAARASGARIVHTCGFDSIPSDIGTLLLHEVAQAEGLGDLEETTYVVKSMRGGASGGTIDSLRTAVDTVKKDSSSRKILADPYALSPNRDAEPDLGGEREAIHPRHVEVDKRQRAILMLRHERQRRMPIAGLQYVGDAVIELQQQFAHAFAVQRVIVGDKNFHNYDASEAMSRNIRPARLVPKD